MVCMEPSRKPLKCMYILDLFSYYDDFIFDVMPSVCFIVSTIIQYRNNHSRIS